MSEQAQAPAWLRLPKTPAELLADAQAAKIREINAAYTEQVRPLVRDYPEIEQQTWVAQNTEAGEYLAWHASQQGDAPATPVLDAILLGRNGDGGSETLYQLSLAVRDNAERFTQAQQLTGRRQRLVKQVRAAETEEAANAIEW
ncbi:MULTISPECIES: hypothetical protein [unclassified Halomonas]|uniref:hypothetical protein n=1 Tax=unclassified Halomonas TaxID=2609666 RepID=UPI001EF3F301|nr:MULTISPECIES: hypothetical protein [unclassified Halomonas]MCG7589665.1 hypothetical protein [Halomonas sp. McD50-5]MCG7616286.1 hypothetical protein [Halomonas sp. McD50-4]